MIEHNTTTLLSQEELGTLIAQAGGIGSWQLLSYPCPINPIHAALLRTGRVLFIAGSGNDPNNVNDPQGSAVWNVSAGTFTRPTTPLDGAGFPIDLFCVGHSFLADGRLMCAGGTDQYDPFHGLPGALIFDPSTNTWIKEVSQADGARWYPTLITLGDGRIISMSGLDENGGLDTYPEIYTPGTGWQYFAGPDVGWAYPTIRYPMYSHLFLMQDGKIFYSGAYFESTGVGPHIITVPPINQPFQQTPVGGLQAPEYCDQAASVLLPPAQDQKVMIIGGGNGYYGATTNRVNIVDLKVSSPSYTPAAPLNFARMHACAVLLPDRTVFVCNGTGMGEDMNTGTRTAEIYNPATNTWSLAATAAVIRPYHSLALLLPDGRVATAGGNPDRGTQEKRLEIYSPAYMSQSRPGISSVSLTTWSYGGTFRINTNQAAAIKWVSLIKPMAGTHSLDTEQRLVDVPISSRTSTSLTVTVTSNRNLAPPGYYMLFITNNKNVPSTAKWIRLG